MTAHASTTGLSVLNPILVLPSSPPVPLPAVPSVLDSSSLEDYPLLRSARGPLVPERRIRAATCDARQRLSDILGLSPEPSPLDAQTQAANPRLDPIQLVTVTWPTSPSTTPSPPPRYTMRNEDTTMRTSQPSTAHKSKTPRSSFRHRARFTPKSTLSRSFRLAAPVARPPLASVLQCFAAHSTGEDSAEAMDVDAAGDEREAYARSEHVPAHTRRRGLGILLGIGEPAPHHYLHPRGAHEPLQAPTRFSQRLRRLAPRPLQLSSAAPSYTQAASAQCACAAGSPTEHERNPASARFVDVPLDTARALQAESARMPPMEDIPSADLSPSPPYQAHWSSFAGAGERLRGRTDSRVRVPLAEVFHEQPTTNATKNTTTDMNADMIMDTNSNSNKENIHANADYPSYLDFGSGVTYASTPSQRRPSLPSATHDLTAHAYHEPSPLLEPHPPYFAYPRAAPPPPEIPVAVRMPLLGVFDPPHPSLTAQSPTGPPPLPPQQRIPLPPPSDDDTGRTWDWDVRAGARADLRLDLGAEDLALRADRCAEAIARASFVRLLSPLRPSIARNADTTHTHIVAALMQPAARPRRARGVVRAPRAHVSRGATCAWGHPRGLPHRRRGGAAHVVREALQSRWLARPVCPPLLHSYLRRVSLECMLTACAGI